MDIHNCAPQVNPLYHVYAMNTTTINLMVKPFYSSISHTSYLSGGRWDSDNSSPI